MAVRIYGIRDDESLNCQGRVVSQLWILTTLSGLLKDRRVICHTVVLVDVVNVGEVYVPDKSHVVIVGNLVTVRPAADLELIVKLL